MCRAHSTQVSTSRETRSQEEQAQTFNTPPFRGALERKRAPLAAAAGPGDDNPASSSAGHPKRSAGHRGFPPSAASRVLSAPFDLCGHLKPHYSLMPGCWTLSPAHPGLASPHQLHLLIQTFKIENCPQTASFHFPFPKLTLSCLGLRVQRDFVL